MERIIFIDPMQPCVTNKKWPWPTACHLFVSVDTPLERLHEFADRIGLKRQWFQHKPGGLPHYDLTPKKRELAITYGATEVSIHDTAQAIREWRLWQ